MVALFETVTVQLNKWRFAQEKQHWWSNHSNERNTNPLQLLLHEVVCDPDSDIIITIYLSTQYIIFTMMDTNHDANHVSFPRNPHPKVAFWKQGQPMSAVPTSWMPKGLLGHSWLKGIWKSMKRQEFLKPRQRPKFRPCQIGEPSTSLMWYKVYTLYVYVFIYKYVCMYVCMYVYIYIYQKVWIYRLTWLAVQWNCLYQFTWWYPDHVKYTKSSAKSLENPWCFQRLNICVLLVWLLSSGGAAVLASAGVFPSGARSAPKPFAAPATGAVEPMVSGTGAVFCGNKNMVTLWLCQNSYWKWP